MQFQTLHVSAGEITSALIGMDDFILRCLIWRNKKSNSKQCNQPSITKPFVDISLYLVEEMTKSDLNNCLLDFSIPVLQRVSIWTLKRLSID